ncbi:MAG TPA: ABC transporter ATP-binding protein [Streptosporangiaceae bacterium]|nr:ABC transporter ATP-binding protein [Streptosporangiaceae bacterium]
MYQLTGVTKDYQKGRGVVHALQGVDLAISDSEWLAIQGPTGHGKSTLLQMLGGLDKPTSGSIQFGQNGSAVDLAQLREGQVTRIRAESIGFIFQTFNLVPTLSAQENVEAALVPLGVHTASRRERAERALADVGLADRTRHLPSELSGGQQQRVAIARALVKEPKVLLADEPTGNLDEGTRDEIIGLLQKLWQDLGLTLVLVTHDSSVARRAQRVGIMQNGKISIRQDTRPAPAS